MKVWYIIDTLTNCVEKFDTCEDVATYTADKNLYSLIVVCREYQDVITEVISDYTVNIRMSVNDYDDIIDELREQCW